ncbi:MAG: acylphosphatase [Gemmatimonadota bacterium]
MAREREREVVALHVRVSGTVQGVGFRWFVRERARRLGLAGWVRNAEDGSVEIAAEGEEPQIELLRLELQKGPSGAMVKAVEDVEGGFTEPIETPFGIVR